MAHLRPFSRGGVRHTFDPDERRQRVHATPFRIDDTPSIRVIDIVVAHPAAILRRGISLLLSSQPGLRVDGEAGDPDTAVRMADERATDVVLSDASLATSVLVRIGGKGRRARVVVVADDACRLTPQEALRAGAAAFVRAHSSPDLLIDAVRRVAAGARYLDPALGAVVTADPAKERPMSELTGRQLEVLRLLALGHTNRQIAERLGVSVRTVEGHRSQMQERLGLATRADVVRYARESRLIEPS